MATPSTKAPTDDEASPIDHLRQLESPIARRSVERLRKQFAKDLVPIDELRDELDEALGDRTLKEFLDDTRGRH